MPIKILLTDDHKILREGLKKLLLERDDMEIVGEANDGREAVNIAQQLLPDIVVMDISMPNLNGIEASKIMLKNNPLIKIIILTINSDKRYLESALKAGVRGYLLKDCAFDELITAIKCVNFNKTYISPDIAGLLVENLVLSNQINEKEEKKLLTQREREILQLLSEGKSTKEISKTLSLSIKTIETHRQQIMSKLKLFSVAELTKYAIREGITSI